MAKVTYDEVMQAVREAAEIVMVYCRGQDDCRFCILQGKGGRACDIPEHWKIKKHDQEGE